MRQALTVSLATILGLFAVLQIKHFVCDFPLQTRYQLVNKGTYGHPGGILHSAIHAIATTLAFLVLTPTLIVGAVIVVGEFLLHYHIDWTKMQIMKATDWSSQQWQFWWAMGFDQLAHHLTYLAIIAVLVVTAAA